MPIMEVTVKKPTKGNVMTFSVAIKKDDYTAEFTFNTEEERAEFIEVTKKMHPTTEFLLSEEALYDSPVVKYSLTA